MKKRLLNKSRVALIVVIVLMLSTVTVFANPSAVTQGYVAVSNEETVFVGHSSMGMGGSSSGTDLKLIIETNSRFRLETTKPRGSGSYKITEENGINKIVFTYDDLVDGKPFEMIGTVNKTDLTENDIIIKIENVVYNIAGMGAMKMGEVEFKKEAVAPVVQAIQSNVVYKGKAAFGMQAGSFTAMTITIMPNMRFSVETTKPRGEGTYEITVNKDNTNTISFTYDDKTIEEKILSMTGKVSDIDLSKADVTIEIENATYPLNGMKPLNLGYLKLIVPNDTPSEMYKSSTDEAVKLGLIPEEMQNSYNVSLTRQEACELIVNLIEKKDGKTIDEILTSKSLSLDEKKFEDCTSKAVYAMEALDIVNGVSKTEFKPHILLNKEELAVILSNTLKNYFNYTNENAELKAMDASKISDWAKQAAATVLDLKIKDNPLIGLENGLFNPTNHISREQAYLIILNLFEYQK